MMFVCEATQRLSINNQWCWFVVLYSDDDDDDDDDVDDVSACSGPSGDLLPCHSLLVSIYYATRSFLSRAN